MHPSGALLNPKWTLWEFSNPLGFLGWAWKVLTWALKLICSVSVCKTLLVDSGFPGP